MDVRRSRWGRSTGKKQGAEPQTVSPREEGPILGTEMETQAPVLEVLEVEVRVETEEGQREKERRTEEERTLVHFASREEADDQVLIKDENRGREEEKEEMKGQEGMKVMRKRSTLKNYRKTFDRAFRRGWETFVTNLYSVTLTPDSSSSSSSPSREMHHSSALAEYR